ARIARVVDREAVRPVKARPADRAHIGMAVLHLDEAAAAPRGGRIVAEQTEILRLLGITCAHDRCSVGSSWPSLSTAKRTPRRAAPPSTDEPRRRIDGAGPE